MVFTRIVAWEVGGCDIGDRLGVDSNDLGCVSILLTVVGSSEAYRPSSAEPLRAILAREPLDNNGSSTQFGLIELRELQMFSAPIGSLG